MPGTPRFLPSSSCLPIAQGFAVERKLLYTQLSHHSTLVAVVRTGRSSRIPHGSPTSLRPCGASLHGSPTSRRPCDASPTKASRPGLLMGVTACQDPHEEPRTTSDGHPGHGAPADPRTPRTPDRP